MEFQRFTAPDVAAHEAGIAEQRARLAAAQQAGDELALLDCTADLAGLLTTARREAEALALLEAQLGRIEQFSASEVSGWFWNAYATALQYSDRRDDAHPAFARALALSRAGGWLRLQAFVLQHWGRSLAEQGDLDQAKVKFEQALAIRQQLGDPRTASTEKALAGLAELRASGAGAAFTPSPLLHGACHCGAVRLTLPSHPEKATQCNCSLCRRVGGLWAYYELGTVKVEGHPEHTTDYVWGDKTLRTMRCAHCGCVTHWEPLAPEAGARHGVNLNNFDPRLMAAVQVRRFDGAVTWAYLD
jgi:hypothetical protein